MPDNVRLVNWGGPAVSPDGRRIVFAAMSANGASSLWIRTLESVTSRELPGTENGYAPFWSPDGQSVGYYASGELYRTDLSGGAVQRICTLPAVDAAGADWNRDGTILFGTGGRNARLYTVAASGGEPRPVTGPGPSPENGHFWPKFLPDGRHFLFQDTAAPPRQGIYISSLDTPEQRRKLLPWLTRAEYRGGHLLFTRGGNLLAQQLDVARGTLSGEPQVLASSLASVGVVPDWGMYSASGSLLAYGEATTSDSELVWFDRKGNRLGTVGGPGLYGQLALSPDERSVAVELATATAAPDLWTFDLARGVGTRQTVEPAAEADVTWTPNGREIVFASDREGGWHLYRKTLEGSQAETPFGKGLDQIWPESVTPDGQWLLYVRQLDGRRAFGTLSLRDGATGQTILEQPHFLDEPHVSPDGRWLAYVSDESARAEVYVQGFQRAGARVRVSTAGGGQPKWRGDGRELFYVSPEGALMAVEVETTGDRLEVALPVALFQGLDATPIQDKYAPTRDGQRFLAPVLLGADTGRIHVVTNWPSLLPAPAR